MIRTLAVCLAVSFVAAQAAAEDLPGQGQIAITAETGQKPQSKLWYDQGTWWAALPQAGGVFLWRCAGGKFEPQETPGALAGTRDNAECDVLLKDGTLFVLAYQRNPNETRLYALKFTDGAYRLLAGYPARLPYAGKASTMTCDADSKGTLWVGYLREDSKAVVHSFSPADPKAGFSAAIEVAASSGPGNIVVVRAFKGHVGVMWSDQKVERFGFRAHRDDKPADQWEPEETALAGKDLVNDHVSLAVDADGNVVSMTKSQTGPKKAGAPLILSRRSADGKWSEVARIPSVNQEKTRPIVVLDAEKPMAYVFYTDRAVKPNTICLTPVSLADGKVGKEITVLKLEHNLNNAAASKRAVTEAAGLMILAGAFDPKQGPAAFRLLALKDIR